jgi:glycosyltransferase involved in cell wall biosynthesis
MGLLSIIVLNYRRLKYTRQTVECLLKKTTVPHELILVDNSAPQLDNSPLALETRAYLEGVVGNEHCVKVVKVFNEKNLGVAGGRNEGLRVAAGDYLLNIDDDVLVPDNYDRLLIEACDKIPKLGITGVNVEPVKYDLKNINGVNVRPKTVGNLGGAALCLPRRVFNRVGYYSAFGNYGLEDSLMYVRLKKLGLLSAYIEPRGVHLDTDAEKVYRAVKTRAQTKGSPQLKAFSQAKLEIEQTGNVYVPYVKFDPDDPKWATFEKLDGTLEQG